VCIKFFFNPLNTKLNPICHLLALLAHHILHVSRIRGKLARTVTESSEMLKLAFKRKGAEMEQMICLPKVQKVK
jgi:hypothetical protein